MNCAYASAGTPKKGSGEPAGFAPAHQPNSAPPSRRCTHAAHPSPWRLWSGCTRSTNPCATSTAVQGAFVECGVWRGGSITISYVIAPGRKDGAPLLSLRYFHWDARAGTGGRGARALPVEEPAVKRGLGEIVDRRGRSKLFSTGLAKESFSLVEGRVEETIPASAPDTIALLRLDTDWYSSTRHELFYLYPRLEPGGVLIIDDYGHFEGARQAVDEYFEDGQPLLFTRIDYSCHLAVKPHR